MQDCPRPVQPTHWGAYGQRLRSRERRCPCLPDESEETGEACWRWRWWFRSVARAEQTRSVHDQAEVRLYASGRARLEYLLGGFFESLGKMTALSGRDRHHQHRRRRRRRRRARQTGGGWSQQALTSAGTPARTKLEQFIVAARERGSARATLQRTSPPWHGHHQLTASPAVPAVLLSSWWFFHFYCFLVLLQYCL